MRDRAPVVKILCENFFNMEWIGISISLSASGLAALGVNLQALGLQKDTVVEENERLLSTNSLDEPNQTSQNEENQFQISKNNLWTIGFCLYIIFETFGSIAALAFISPVILAPLGASGLVFNVLWSKMLLGTHTSNLDVVATGLVGVGAGLVAWFGVRLPNGGL